MQNLSLLGKITIFKMPALSKIIHLALVTCVLTATIEFLKYKKSLKYKRLNMTPYVMIMRMED